MVARRVLIAAVVLTALALGSQASARAPDGTPARASGGIAVSGAGVATPSAAGAVEGPLSATPVDEADVDLPDSKPAADPKLSFGSRVSPNGSGMHAGSRRSAFGVVRKWPGAGSTGWSPADVQIAVGPADIVELVNQTAVDYTRSGVVRQQKTLGEFFSSTSFDRRADNVTDPRAVYDAPTGRWFFSVFDVTQRQTVLYVSAGSDPLGPAALYWFNSAGCPDQPRLGVSDGLVALSVDLFSDCGSFGVRVGGEVLLLDKANLLNAQPVDYDWYGPDIRFGAITPVVSLSAAPALYMVATDYAFDALEVFSASVVHQASIPFVAVGVRSIALPPNALQSDPLLVDTGDNRVQNAAYENGNIYVAYSDGCLIQGENGQFACGRYDVVSTAAMTLSADAEFALADNRDLFYPVFLPASDGTTYTAFGFSSPSETPGIGFVANPTTPSTWTTISTGQGAAESGRWGDYFGIARDPVDPTKVWVAAEFGAGGSNWGTTIAELGAQAPSPPPPGAGSDSTPPSVRAIGTGGGAGVVGKSMKLLFQVSDDSGKAASRLQVRSGGTTAAQWSYGLQQVEGDATYYVRWAPRRPGSYRFCVTARDAAGNASATSCAPVVVRR